MAEIKLRANTVQPAVLPTKLSYIPRTNEKIQVFITKFRVENKTGDRVTCILVKFLFHLISIYYIRIPILIFNFRFYSLSLFISILIFVLLSLSL